RGQGNKAAETLAGYIASMYSDTRHFTTSPYIYNPQHPVITKVMFYPDNSGDPDHEWVEITNPTGSEVSLAYYVIGDAENLISGDNESLYIFPENASIPAGGSIIVAYSAAAYYEDYGKYPDYEIIDTVASVPNLKAYDTSKYNGTWNLDDSGDEVILGKSYYGFIVVVDAVWYGNSPYMNSSLGRPKSAEPLNTTNISPGDIIVDKYLTGDSTGYDAIRMSDKYEIAFQPQPIPENTLTIAVPIAIVILILVAALARRTG
ncbi:MAG: lamin tail domain-containing protein, partial [Desulfurococcales archaeon]|nr:lamin tail domain-containing protein [Desulfurococcales archaeon]